MSGPEKLFEGMREQTDEIFQSLETNLDNARPSFIPKSTPEQISLREAWKRFTASFVLDLR